MHQKDKAGKGWETVGGCLPVREADVAWKPHDSQSWGCLEAELLMQVKLQP